MLRKLALALAVASAFAIPQEAMAWHAGGGHGGFHAGGHVGGFHGGYGGRGFHGVGRGRYWGGRWYGYGVGPCWRWNPAWGNWVWICG